jgi:uncharacterized protein (TIGR02246 family)
MTQALDSTMVLHRYVAAVEAGDQAAVRELFSEDATWRLDACELPTSGTWEGRDQIMDGFFATAMSHYEPGSVNLEITAMIVGDDEVVLQWTSRARTTDGRPYENGCIGLFTIRDGEIQAVSEYMDTLYVREVLFSDLAP